MKRPNLNLVFSTLIIGLIPFSMGLWQIDTPFGGGIGPAHANEDEDIESTGKRNFNSDFEVKLWCEDNQSPPQVQEVVKDQDDNTAVGGTVWKVLFDVSVDGDANDEWPTYGIAIGEKWPYKVKLFDDMGVEKDTIDIEIERKD